MNIFEALREDHDIQRELLKKLTDTSGESKERTELFKELKRELAMHADAEERYFYKPLIDSNLTQEKARHSIAEHHEIDEYIEQLEETDPSSPGWLIKAKKLQERVEHHLEEEEHEVFQMAGKVLSEGSKQDLASGYKDYMNDNRPWAVPKLSPKIIDKIIESPEDAIDQVSLVYVDDSKLSISRHGDPKTFKYHYKGEVLSDTLQLQRIEELVIPPAWQGVRITHLENGHLQAVGRDAKKRKQYRYHETWSKIRNQTKFFRLAAFGRTLPKIRTEVEEKLAFEKWTAEKAIALVIKLMDETHIRIGNYEYSRKNNTYGLVTMRKRHVVHDENRLRFEFVGKRGKEHLVTIKNKKLIRLIRQCEEIPGWELFQFFDGEGNKNTLDSSMVNNFLHDLTGQHFTAKDFRTWSATVIFYETLKDLSEQKDIDDDKKLLISYDAAAQALGNTRNVCRKYYVHPEIVNAFENGFKSIKTDDISFTSFETNILSSSEREVLQIIENYRPKIA